MNTLTFSGGKTSSIVTSALREVPVLADFPTVAGRAKDVKVTVPLRVSEIANFTFDVYLFKTFIYDPQYWGLRNSGDYAGYSHYYQYPASSDHYLSAGHMSDVLAVASGVSMSVSTGEHTIDLSLTEYGRTLTNWSGGVCVGIVEQTRKLYFNKNATCGLTMNYTSGVVSYGANGSFVDCQMYYGVGGGYVEVAPYYGADGGFVEIGK